VWQLLAWLNPVVTGCYLLLCAGITRCAVLRDSLCICIVFIDVLIYSAAKAASVFNKLTLLYFAGHRFFEPPYARTIDSTALSGFGRHGRPVPAVSKERAYCGT